MLKPIDQELDDYTCARMTITEADCKNLIAYARKYKSRKAPSFTIFPSIARKHIRTDCLSAAFTTRALRSRATGALFPMTCGKRRRL